MTAQSYGHRDAAIAYFERTIELTDKVNFGNIFRDCALVEMAPNPCMGLDQRAFAMRFRNELAKSRRST